MSRLPSARGIPAPSSNQKRLSRQPSLDLRRRKHHQDDVPPPPVPYLKTSKSTRTPSLSRASISSYEDMESPVSLSRYSLSSAGSAQTAMTSPRSSLASSRNSTIRKSVTTVAQQQHQQQHQQQPPMPKNGAPFRVGERVAVDSMGIVGTLRFLGTTQFKDGAWAGIELDIVGTGKNDGSVQGIRYFSCPPQTGLFVQANKVKSLDDHPRSPSPQITPGSRAARYVGMTVMQLTQQQQQNQQQQSKRSSSTTGRPISLRRPPSTTPAAARAALVQSPTPIHRRPTTDAIPSPAITPNQDEDEDEDEEDEMLTDMPAPANLASSKSIDSHTRLERMLGEAIASAPDEAVMRVQQLQLRVEVLEAENKFLKLENAQNKTAEQILERSVLLNSGTGESFSLEGHKAIVDEIKAEHENMKKQWDQEKDSIQGQIHKLEDRVKELETEQIELIKERDQLLTDLAEARKDKVQIESRVRELEQKVAYAEAEAAKAAAAAEARTAVPTTSNFYSDDPEEMRERQMQMEMEIEEVHEKMGSLMDAMRAKDFFMTTLTEQVEQHRNTVEEREREVRRTKADAERHMREKERLKEEIKDLESKWESHQDCATKEEFDKLKRQLAQAKESLARESGLIDEYRTRIDGLEQSVDELKRAGMESIELYESSVELHRVDMEAIKASLDDERRKVIALEKERENLRKAGLEAIETYESTIEELKREQLSNSEESSRKQEEMQATVDKLKQEISQLVNARDTSDEIENIKAVWESERKRLEANLGASIQALSKEREQYETLKNESDKLRDQIRQSANQGKENEKLQEEVQRLQANYDEQLNARNKYLDDVRSAVESQKKTEGELRRLVESKEKTERDLATAQESMARAEAAMNDLRKHGGDPEALLKEREQHEKELDVLRTEIEKLSAQNTMLTKQKESIQLEAKADDKLKQQVEILQAENKRLTKEFNSLTESHKQVENECMKLMDEVEKLHAENESTTGILPVAVNLENCDTDEEIVKQLQGQLVDVKRQMERLSVKQTSEIRKLNDKHIEDERTHKRQMDALNREVAELEGLIESKIFKEADLEEALEKERKQSKRLRDELNDLKQHLKQQDEVRLSTAASKMTTTGKTNGATGNTLFCELCDQPGHDLMGCKVVVPEKHKVEVDRPFCVNCDEYGLHSTETCPNQNETF